MSEIQLLSPNPIPSLPAETGIDPSALTFRHGEIHRARVLQRREPDRFFLQVGDRRLWVESRASLPDSEPFLLRVEATDPRVVLKLLSPQAPKETTISSLLKRSLAADVPLQFLAERLSLIARQELCGIPPSAQGLLGEFQSLLRSFPDLSALHPETLRTGAEKWGFFWENKIRNWMEGTQGNGLLRLLQEDLKGLGMKLLAALQEASQEGDLSRVEILKRDLEAFILKIELYQILNHSRNPEEMGRLYFFFPLWYGSHLQLVDFNLSFPKKKRGHRGDEGFSLLFLLNLPSWGKVRIEVQTRDRALFCQFWVGNQPAADTIRSGLGALKSQLEKWGFDPHLQVSLKGNETLDATIAQEMGKEEASLLSVII